MNHLSTTDKIFMIVSLEIRDINIIHALICTYELAEEYIDTTIDSNAALFELREKYNTAYVYDYIKKIGIDKFYYHSETDYKYKITFDENTTLESIESVSIIIGDINV